MLWTRKSFWYLLSQNCSSVSPPAFRNSFPPARVLKEPIVTTWWFSRAKNPKWLSTQVSYLSSTHLLWTFSQFFLVCVCMYIWYLYPVARIKWFLNLLIYLFCFKCFCHVHRGPIRERKESLFFFSLLIVLERFVSSVVSFTSTSLIFLVVL